MKDKCATIVVFSMILCSCSNNQSSSPRANTNTISLENQIEQLTKENTRLKVYADSLLQENAKKDQIINEIKQFFN